MFHRHKWADTSLLLQDVYVSFARPIGQAKMQYCYKCGITRLAGLKENDCLEKYYVKTTSPQAQEG